MLNEHIDFKFLRYSFALAEDAKLRGIHPFSAVLVDANGEILLEQINGYLPDLDMTGHAERVIMTKASKLYRPDFLQTCTLYVSAEPCAMCAGAIYWAGVLFFFSSFFWLFLGLFNAFLDILKSLCLYLPFQCPQL